MTSFTKDQSFSDFQRVIDKIYALPDDRMFSLWDLLSNQERFTMRALKGIRKGNQDKVRQNLLIAFSWLMAVANRLHINVEEAVLKRFPGLCSYCGSCPCKCSEIKPQVRKELTVPDDAKPRSLHELQVMFRSIYPPEMRTLADAGVHLAEEMGEVNEAVLIFLGEHKAKQFETIEEEIADYISCMFGVANSSDIVVAKELALMYKNNCYVCHKAQCQCNFSFIAAYKS